MSEPHAPQHSAGDHAGHAPDPQTAADSASARGWNWADLVYPIAFFLAAILPFTPLWGELADPSERGRNAGISRLLAFLGPVTVSVALAAIGVGLLVMFIVKLHRPR